MRLPPNNNFCLANEYLRGADMGHNKIRNGILLFLATNLDSRHELQFLVETYPWSNGVGAISHDSRSSLVFIRDKITVERYIQEAVKPHVLPCPRTCRQTHFGLLCCSDHQAFLVFYALNTKEQKECGSLIILIKRIITFKKLSLLMRISDSRSQMLQNHVDHGF